MAKSLKEAKGSRAIPLIPLSAGAIREFDETWEHVQTLL